MTADAEHGMRFGTATRAWTQLPSRAADRPFTAWGALIRLQALGHVIWILSPASYCQHPGIGTHARSETQQGFDLQTRLRACHSPALNTPTQTLGPCNATAGKKHHEEGQLLHGRLMVLTPKT